MILADKIIDLRKKNGLSQEELAEKMNVSRQSVSKWEGAQSVPDLNKIIALSEIFGVSTDYLLKDSIEAPEFTAKEESGEALRRVSMEEANTYLTANRSYAGKVAVGVLLCILSVIPLIALSMLSDNDDLVIMGAVLMIAMVGIAVWQFIGAGSKVSGYEYLEKEPIDTEYGVSGMVSERRTEFKPKQTKAIAVGVMLFFVGLIALLVFAVYADHEESWEMAATNGVEYEVTRYDSKEDIYLTAGLCSMLALAAVGVFLIVRSSIIMGGFERLLEEGDFTREKKQDSKCSVNIVMIFWLLLVAAFLAVSFIWESWNWSWAIFVVGGVLTPVVSELQKLVKKR